MISNPFTNDASFKIEKFHKKWSDDGPKSKKKLGISSQKSNKT